MEFELQTAGRPATATTPAPTAPAAPMPAPPAPADGDRTSSTELVRSFAAELNGYYTVIRSYPNLEPDEVLRSLSGVSARLTEMRAVCCRLSDRGDCRSADKLRIKEIDPLLEECDRQFKYHSRIQTTRELDWRMAGGGT